MGTNGTSPYHCTDYERRYRRVLAGNAWGENGRVRRLCENGDEGGNCRGNISYRPSGRLEEAGKHRFFPSFIDAVEQTVTFDDHFLAVERYRAEPFRYANNISAVHIYG